MKAEILKIAGVKSEKEFYKLFPTQEAFMKVHGDAFNELKQAQNGTDMNGNGIPDYLEGIQPMVGPQNANQFSYPNQFPQNTGFRPMTNFGAKPQNNFATGNAGNQWAKKNPLPQGMDALTFKENTQQTYKPQNSQTQQQGGDQGMAIVGKIVDAAKTLKAERRALKEAKQWRTVSNYTLNAARSRDVNIRQDLADNAARTRKALMPTITGDALFPVNGVGTNVLTKDGGKLTKAANGEIMNTYYPNTIYTNLEYEPLKESFNPGFTPINDTNTVKQYYYGGKAQWGAAMSGASSAMGSGGFGGMMSSFGGMMGGSGGGGMMGGGGGWGSMATGASEGASSLISNAYGNNAGAQFGGAAGDIVGMINPIAGAIAKPIFTAVGGALDKNPRKIKRNQARMRENIQTMGLITNMQDLAGGQYSGSMEDGGNMNPTVIKYFGNQPVNKLFTQDPIMDTLRSGGNLRSNEVGNIQIAENGDLRPISYNPYNPGLGVTSMIEGPSHEDGGVNISYERNMVEAEGGEPIRETHDSESPGNLSAVITGNQTFNKMGANEIPELKEYEGKKVKHIQKDLAEKDAKLNKLQTKNSKILAEFNPRTPIDKLKFNSLSMNEKGIDDQYKINAAKSDLLVAYQDAVNEEAHMRGLDAGELTRGKLKSIDPDAARDGIQLKAQDGTSKNKKITRADVKKTRALREAPQGQHKEGDLYGGVTEEQFQALKEGNPWYDWSTFKPSRPGDVKHFQTQFNELASSVGSPERLKEDDLLGRQTASARIDLGPVKTAPASPVEENQPEVYEVTPYRKHGLETLAAQLLPWFRKVPGEPLQGDQLAGEMFALSNNQVEPVQARFYHPLLDVPYDITYQDRLNENQATFNALKRMASGNPEALAALAGQKYGADSSVLAEQFRANQAMKDRVYSGNRATLNEAQRYNLGLMDQQYVRQAQAKSNTKAVTQEALNSIASKIAQNRLENRTLQTYSNMFPDFSFDRDYRLRKTGAPTSFNMPVVYGPTGEITHIAQYDSDGNIIDYKEVTPEERKKLTKPENATPSIKAEAKHGVNLAKAFRNL